MKLLSPKLTVKSFEPASVLLVTSLAVLLQQNIFIWNELRQSARLARVALAVARQVERRDAVRARVTPEVHLLAVPPLDLPIHASNGLHRVDVQRQGRIPGRLRGAEPVHSSLRLVLH